MLKTDHDPDPDLLAPLGGRQWPSFPVTSVFTHTQTNCFQFLSHWAGLLFIPSRLRSSCSKFKCESLLGMPLRRQENCLEEEYRVSEALIMLWTPSLLPQTILFLHFLKMQFGFDAAGGCARHREGKEERRSRGIHGPAGETTYRRTGQNSQQSGFWSTGLGLTQHRPISSFPDVHFAWVPVFSPRCLPVSSISILLLPQIQQHATRTPLSSFLPEDALACS